MERLTQATEGYLKPGDNVSELNNDAWLYHRSQILQLIQTSCAVRTVSYYLNYQNFTNTPDLSGTGLWTEDSGNLYPTTLSNNVQVGGTAADPDITLSAAEGKAIFGSTIRVAGEPWYAERGAAMAAGTIQECNITGAATFTWQRGRPSR